MKKSNKSVLVALLASFCLSQTPAVFATNPKVHLDVGLNHFYKNRYLDAYKEFKKALELDPTYAEAYYNLGRVYKAQGLTKEAIIEFQLAIRMNPDYSAAKRELDSLSKVLATDSNAQYKMQGRDTYRQTDFNTMNADVAEAKAKDMLNKGNTEEAIRYYNIVVQQRPNDVSAHKMVGFLNFNQNSFTDALASYQKARSLAPTDSEIPYAIGLIYMKTGSPSKAEAFFKDAIKLNSVMIKAYFALGESYEAQEKLDDAVFQYKKCLEMNPNLKEAKNKLDYMIGKQSYNYFSRGSYHYQRGEYDKALPLLQMAKTHGVLTADQRRQAEEMLNSSQYWVNKNQAEKRIRDQRNQVRAETNLGKSCTVTDVVENPATYIGKAVEWSGYAEFIEENRGRLTICVNGITKNDPKSNMDGCFMVVLPKSIEDDPRVSDMSYIRVKGRIKKVEKIYYDGYGFSQKKQPFIDAVEVEFNREEYAPLILRF